jgi:hypothetical protein
MTTAKTVDVVLAEIALVGEPFGSASLAPGALGMHGYTWSQLDAAGAAIGTAKRAGRDWRWSDAEAALGRAYAALGAVNPGSGYAWHCGQHPLQTAIDAIDGAA